MGNSIGSEAVVVSMDDGDDDGSNNNNNNNNNEADDHDDKKTSREEEGQDPKQHQGEGRKKNQDKTMLTSTSTTTAASASSTPSCDDGGCTDTTTSSTKAEKSVSEGRGKGRGLQNEEGQQEQDPMTTMTDLTAGASGTAEGGESATASPSGCDDIGTSSTKAADAPEMTTSASEEEKDQGQVREGQQDQQGQMMVIVADHHAEETEKGDDESSKVVDTQPTDTDGDDDTDDDYNDWKSDYEFFLPLYVVQFHEESDKKPWTTDREYILGLIAVEWTRLAAYHLKVSLGNDVVTNSNKSGRGGGTVGESSSIFANPMGSHAANGKQLSLRFKRELKKFEIKFENKLKAMKKRPVLEKLIDTTTSGYRGSSTGSTEQAHKQQRTIYRFVVACSILQSLPEFPRVLDPTSTMVGGAAMEMGFDAISTSLSLYTIQQLFAYTSNTHISSSQLFAMFSSSASPWVKEGLLLPGSYRGGLTYQTSIITCHKSNLRAMAGIEIDVEGFDKIPSKTLRKVLLCDEWFKGTATGKVLLRNIAKAQAAAKNKRKGEASPTSNNMLQLAIKESTEAQPNKKRRVLDVLSMLRTNNNGATSSEVVDSATGSASTSSNSSKSAHKKKKDADDTPPAAATKNRSYLSASVLADDENCSNNNMPTEADKSSQQKQQEEDSSPLRGVEPESTSTADNPAMECESSKDTGDKYDAASDVAVAPTPPAESTNEKDDGEDDVFGPYKSDLDYLQDQCRLMLAEASLNSAKSRLQQKDDNDNHESSPYDGRGDMLTQERGGRLPHGSKPLKQLVDSLSLKVERLTERIRTKLARTQAEMPRQPRLEQLCEALSLSKFEKYSILSLVNFLIIPGRNGRNAGSATVGSLINSFCESLEDRMKSRAYFYKSNTLIREGILTLAQPDFKTDLSHCKVELDRRMFDFIVGLDTEFSEIVDGSHLYAPNVNLDDVVLPQDTKKRVCDSVMNHDSVKSIFETLEVDQKITSGLGNIILFYGASGTGKTMLANAIATKLKKKVLLVNFPNIGTNESGEIIKFLFREARINGALLFFDECEQIFKSRDKGGNAINMILTEIERFDGLCILATNRAYDLDEAMHRRITLAIEFRKPDHILREKIWKTLKPPLLPVQDDIEYGALAKKYELTGGLVKNAWLQSVSLMCRRGGESISQEDLMQAASEQVAGHLSMEDFDRRVVPTVGIDKMILQSDIKEALVSIIHYTKAQSVLFNQWGFEKLHRANTGVHALFTGPPGTGKTMAAEAIGFDLGCPLLVVNASELVNKYVGETGKNINRVFADAKKKGAVLVFDEAEGLFASRGTGSQSSVSRHDSLNVGILLQQIEAFEGVCIAITNLKSAIDEAFFRRFRFVLNFELPDVETREKIWKSMVPDNCPLSKDVNFRDLASRYEMAGGNMKNALLRAATVAALRDNEKDRVVTMDDLTKACSAEVEKQGATNLTTSMYS